MGPLGRSNHRSVGLYLCILCGDVDLRNSHCALNDGYAATHPPSATLSIDRLDDATVRAVADLKEVETAEAWRTVHGLVKSDVGESKNLVLFVRRDFANSHLAKLDSQQGTWPPQLGEIAIERDAFQVIGADIGDTVTVHTANGIEHRLTITGSVHDVGQPQARMENLVYGYATIATLEALGEEAYFDEMAMKVADHPLDKAHINDVANTIAALVENRGQQVSRIHIPEPGQHPHAGIMGLLMLTNAAFGLFVLMLSGTIEFNILTSLLAGQTRQIGVMKAIGGTRIQIARAYFAQAAGFGLVATLIALPVGYGVGRWLCDWMAGFLNFDIHSYSVPVWIFAVVFLVGIAIPVIAAAIPVCAEPAVPS